MARLDRALHRAILQAHHNLRPDPAVATRFGRASSGWPCALQIRPQRVPKIDRQHRAFVAALARNDVEGAAVLLEEHLRPIPEVTAAVG